MGKAKPKIAEVSCSPLRFQHGDRILVKVYRRLELSQRKKLRKSIEKWAGDCVEVLIYDATEMEITVEQGKGIIIPK